MQIINREKLIKNLGYKNGRLPKLYRDTLPAVQTDKIFLNIEIPGYNETLFIAEVCVIMSYENAKPKRSKSRIFIKCIKCYRYIPFGRYYQHIKRRDHR